MATVFPKPNFNAENEAAALKDALDGCGTNEQEIIRILSSLTNKQRIQLKDYYQQAYGSDIVDDLMGDLSGDFQDLVVAMMTPMDKYAASELREAMKGIGTDEYVLIEILCSKTNAELEAVKAAYSQEYDKDLSDAVESETSGDFKKFLVSVVNGGRDDSKKTDYNMAKKDAETIYEAGQDSWGTDESDFNKILCTRSWDQLRLTFDTYQDLYGKSIEEVIGDECSGNLKIGFLAIVTYARSASLFFAMRMHSAVKGLGTDEHCLIRCITYRCEVDMKQIKENYKELYGETLGQAIDGDISGDMKKMLLLLVGED